MRVLNFNVFCSNFLQKLQTSVLLSLFLLSFTAFTQSSKDPEFSATEKLVIGYLPEEYKSHPDYLKNQLDGIPTNIELIQYRNASQKTFIDITGNYHTQKTGGYFHYFENGKWLDIQQNLSESTSQQIGIFKSELPIIVDKKTGETSVYLEKNKSNSFKFGKQVSLSFLDESNQTIQTKTQLENTNTEFDSNFLTLKNVFSGIDREQTINYYSVRTNYSIQSPISISDAVKFIELKDKIELHTNYKLAYYEGEMSENGWKGSLIITNEKGEIVATISPAQIFDSYTSSNKDEVAKHVTPGFYKLNSTNSEISILFDADYLRKTDLVYPVVIDPTVSNTYANNQRVQDKNTQFNANCQATMAVTFPISSFSVSGSNLSWRMWAKGYIYANSSTTYYADKVEQRSRVGANGNWTATQNGTGTNFQGSGYNYTQANNGVTYTVNNSTIANGCYNNQNSINYFWQGYQTYFPVSANSSTNVSGCVFNYQELVTNTWSVTTTYSAGATVNAVNSQTICAGQQSTSISFSGTGSSYNWTNNNSAIGLGASGTGTIAAFTGTNNTTSPISSIITVTPMLNGCPGTPTTFTITVNPSAIVTNPGNQTVCVGQSTTTVIFSGTSGATFNWINDNTATGLGANGIGDIPTFTTTNTTSTAITSTITATPTLGTCNGSPVTFTITTTPLPTVTAVTDQTICIGEQSTAITFGGTGTTFNWVNDNTAIGLGANGIGDIAAFTGTNTTSSAITGTITVTPSSGSCVGIPGIFTITVTLLTTPTFTQLGPYCQNATPGTFITSSTNSPAITGTWSPATISTATVGTQVYTFTPATGQCASTATMSVIVSQLITPTFSQLGPYCQNAAPVILPTSSTNTQAISGTWNPTTITTTTAGNATYTFTPASNQCAGTTTMTVLINVQPTVTISSQTICAGQSATLVATANPTGGTYLWSNNQTTSSISVTPNATATYSVLYVINSCNASSNSSVTVNPIINPNFNALGPYCQNSTPGIFTNSSTNNISGTWSPSVISTTTPGNQVYTFTPTAGVCASTSSMTVVTTPLTAPTFNAIGPLCQNTTAPFLALSSTNTPVINGTWNPSTISTTALGTSSYTFTPTVGQCASIAVLNITIGVSPSPDINTNLKQGCTPLSVTLSSVSLPNATYSWTSNGVNIGNGSTLNTVFNSAGCYDIALHVNINGCTSDTIVSNYICVENVPNAAFTVNPNYFSETNQEVTFSNNSSNAINYLWYFGDGDSSTIFEPNHFYSNIVGNMQATLTATSSFGCSDSYSVIIPFRDDIVYYIPNSFTPDGDQNNQEWGPVFTKGFDPFNFHLQVFDRWGELIWESNDARAKWDGTYGSNGTKVQQGTYIYKIKFQPKDTDKKFTISGHINLLK